MSTTVEKVLSRRSRLAIVDEAIEQRAAKLAEARVEIEALAGREEQAAAESPRAEPLKSAFALRTPAHELGRKREALKTTIGNLEREVALLKSERVAADAEQAGRELAERTGEARSLAAKEREARIAAAKAYAALVERWNALAAVLETRSELRSTVAGEQLVERVGVFDREGVEKYERVAGFLVEPVPIDLHGFLEEAIEASTGERPGEEQEGLAELNRHRASLNLAAEVRTVDPSAHELAEVYPDLRGEIRMAEISGAPIRRSAPVDEAPWPEPAA
jgi:hypothetical protein